MRHHRLRGVAQVGEGQENFTIALRHVPTLIGQPVRREAQAVLEGYEKVQDHDLAGRTVGEERRGVRGQDLRMRATASRMAPILAAATALSTTRGGGEDTAGTELLDWPEIQVFEDGLRLPCDEGGAIAHQDYASIAKDAVGQGRRRLVEDHEVYGMAGGGLETRRQPSKLERFQPNARAQAEGDIDIAPWATRAAGSRAEDEGIRHALVGLQDPT